MSEPMREKTPTNFWVSWYGTPPMSSFELHWPWWISGYRMDDDDEHEDTPTIVAGVRAPNEWIAKEIIIAAYDDPPPSLEWRFVEERPNDWTPYESNRFPRADWMPDWPPTNLVGPRPLTDTNATHADSGGGDKPKPEKA